jgi:glycosyltransferase involved in cell wall biosynthesis
MTFSVVIPVYNAEKYIKECLTSVDAMRIPEGVELEVLLIENGSTDSSAGICDAYASKDSKYKSLHFGNIGAYAARREGMKAASGEYIFFADADDLIAENAVEAVLECIRGCAMHGAVDMVIHNAAGMDSRDKRMFDFSADFDAGKLYTEQEKEPFYEVMCRNDSLNALWNKVISKSLADQVVGSEVPRMNHGEDLLQTAELIDKANSIVYLDEILYFYRENAQGLTGSFHREFLENQIDAWSSFDEYAKKWTNGRFRDKISERKTLTCAIAVKSLVYSMLGTKEKKNELAHIMEAPFYNEYALSKLPEWASEEDSFIHGIMTGKDAMGRLCALGRSYRTKAVVKRLIGR